MNRYTVRMRLFWPPLRLPGLASVRSTEAELPTGPSSEQCLG